MSDKELKQIFETRDYDRFGKVDRRKTVNNNYQHKETHLGTRLRIRSADDGYRFPKSVLKIGNYAFKGCYNLTSITL